MKKGKTFVVGDIHGAYRALIQCFDHSGFDLENDHLICLGDVFDGWPEMDLVLELLMKIKHLDYVRGNHEEFALEWADSGKVSSEWKENGGHTTINCFPGGIPFNYLELVRKSKLYHLENNTLYVHAGIVPGVELDRQYADVFLWDRSLFNTVIRNYINNIDQKLFDYDNVFIGHTPLLQYGILKPVNCCGVWMMDTGAGWNGVLTMMDVDSGQVFQSDRVTDLYPGLKGRF
jgi:serine/threonine protein phosphatase 1